MRVLSAETDQFLVSAAFNDTAAMQHQNLIGADNGGKAMSDYDGGSVGHEVLKRFLDQALCRRIHAGGGLIQNQNWRILYHPPTDRATLLFTYSQFYPTFTDH